MEQSDVDILFPIPLYKTILNINLNELNLINSCVENFEYVPYDTNNLRIGEGTVDQKILDNPNFKFLKEKIDKHLDNFLFNILKIKDTKFSHSNSWINKHFCKNLSSYHDHPYSVFSGVFYFNIPSGDSGNIKFYANHPTVSTSTFNFPCSEYNIFNSRTWEYHPENHLLIIFPSHLYHSVSENNTNEARYSLAFNYFIDGEVGDRTKKLTLKIF